MNDTSVNRQRHALRQSNFELLRIIGMLLIVMHHLAVHGDYGEVLAANSAVIKFFEIGGKIGVNLFILISGYFLIDSQFNYKKIIKLLSETTYYSFFIYLFFLACGKIGFTIIDLLSALFPIFSGTYWFATSYIIIYCLFPCLNAIIKNCTKQYLIFAIILLIFIQSVISAFSGANIFSDTGWFLTLYLVAAFLKPYSESGCSNVVYYFVMLELLDCPFHSKLKIFIVFALTGITIVFIVCILIDFFRQFIFNLIKKAALKIKKD